MSIKIAITDKAKDKVRALQGQYIRIFMMEFS